MTAREPPCPTPPTDRGSVATADGGQPGSPSDPYRRALLEHGIWQPESTNLLFDLVRPGDVVADVGTGAGWFTLHLAHAVGPQGHVHAFEPRAQRRAVLQHNLQQNHLEARVTVHPFGLADRERTLLLPAEVDGESPRQEVQLRALDQVAEALDLQRLAVLRLDADGLECDFLRGAGRTMARLRPEIVSSFSNGQLLLHDHSVRVLRRQLLEAGYELCAARNGRPYATELHFLVDCGNYDRGAVALARPIERLCGCPVRAFEQVDDFTAALGFGRHGSLQGLELDTEHEPSERFGRRRRDAEVVAALAANCTDPCLMLGAPSPERIDVLHQNLDSSLLLEPTPNHIGRCGLVILEGVVRSDDARDLSRAAWKLLRPGGFLVWFPFSPQFRHASPQIDGAMTGIARFVASQRGATVMHLRNSWLGALRKP